jgi:hypothetical protein
MFPEWVTEAFKNNGLAGAFIFVLIIGIVQLVKMLRERDATISTLHEQRATERETMVRLFEGANAATRQTAEATEKRNAIMEDLADSQNTLANSIDRHNDRVAGQAEMFKEKLSDMSKVVGSQSDAMRVLTGMVTDVRNATAGSYPRNHGR